MDKSILIQKYKSTIMVNTGADSENALKAAREIAQMQEVMRENAKES